MNKRWISVVFLLALSSLLIQKAFELRHLQNFVPIQRSLKLPHFKSAKLSLNANDQDLLELWESVLTGNTRPLNRLIKEDFSRLGLRHLFTPSGLHLSALLTPGMKLVTSSKAQLTLLTLLALCLFPLPGFVAMKRMLLIKWTQRIFGKKIGFALALLLDVFFGSFQVHALSFTYSFLFLGVIFSGAQGIARYSWFFLAQSLIAFTQGLSIAPLLFLFSPLLSFVFVLFLPALFVLSFPLWEWQLELGLGILRALITVISFSAKLTPLVPAWEMHLGMMALLLLLLLGKKKSSVLLLLLLSGSLNLDLERVPGPGTNDWVPQGRGLRVEERGPKTVAYFTDGKCERGLVRGMWWERCSPRRGSRKKLRKLSCPSSERRRSSLRGSRTSCSASRSRSECKTC